MITKIVTLPNHRMATCSSDKTIKIWKSAPPYDDTPIKVFETKRKTDEMHFHCVHKILRPKQ